jgi:hypothetical protein
MMLRGSKRALPTQHILSPLAAKSPLLEKLLRSEPDRHSPLSICLHLIITRIMNSFLNPMAQGQNPSLFLFKPTPISSRIKILLAESF